MKKSIVIVGIFAWCVCAQGGWFWSDDDDETAEAPRLSELMQPASDMIDEASDLAADGKNSEAVEKYREALKKLDEIEASNGERAKTSEFATLRTKRAYVKAAIDSLLLSEAQMNAKPVAVSDTTELEERMKKERGEIRDKSEDVEGDDLLGMMHKAINLAESGNYREAEVTLNRAMEAYPESFYPRYNMCRLILRANPTNREGAARFYQAGRALGGPKVKAFEELSK